MKAMIFAAGLGTRLRPLTDTMPKALVKVDGEPLLRHVLDFLVSSGFDDITVNVHHFAGQIIDYLRSRGELAQGPGGGVHISDESDALLDTGGGILKAAPLLEGDGPVLVHNVDILSNLDVHELLASARPDAVSTLVVSDRRTSRYLLFDDNMRLVGWTNVNTGEVRSPYPGLDPSGCRKLAFSGIHLITPELLRIMKNGEFRGKFSIMDFYLSIAADCPVYGFVPKDFRMLDVGKPEAIAQSQEFLRSCRMRQQA